MVPSAANVPYGPHGSHSLDVYRAVLGGDKGTIVFVHGGGFTGGDKSELVQGHYGALLRQTHRGWGIVSINYRLAGSAPFPAAYHDTAKAISWVRSNGAAHGLRADRVVVVGHSAGGTLAALVGTTPGAGTEFGPVPMVDRWVALSPITDLSAVSEMGRDYAADWGATSTADRQAGSPITHVSAGQPAGYLVHGENDTVVRVSQSENLARTGRVRGADISFDRVDTGAGCTWHFPACGMDAGAFDAWLG